MNKRLARKIGSSLLLLEATSVKNGITIEKFLTETNYDVSVNKLHTLSKNYPFLVMEENNHIFVKETEFENFIQKIRKQRFILIINTIIIIIIFVIWIIGLILSNRFFP